jgi:hypothetical protein
MGMKLCLLPQGCGDWHFCRLLPHFYQQLRVCIGATRPELTYFIVENNRSQEYFEPTMTTLLVLIFSVFQNDIVSFFQAFKIRYLPLV